MIRLKSYHDLKKIKIHTKIRTKTTNVNYTYYIFILYTYIYSTDKFVYDYIRHIWLSLDEWVSKTYSKHMIIVINECIIKPKSLKFIHHFLIWRVVCILTIAFATIGCKLHYYIFQIVLISNFYDNVPNS